MLGFPSVLWTADEDLWTVTLNPISVIWQWLLLTLGYDHPSPEGKLDPIPEETLEALGRFVHLHVRGGFTDPGEIPEMVSDYLSGEADPDVLRPLGREAVDRELSSLHCEQQTWPQTTDCDRLDAAFQVLEDQGVLTRQNYWCCQTCGHGAIADELDQQQKAGNFARGYVFYHEQDLEGAVEGFGLCLAYGSSEGIKGGATQIATDVVAALTDAGLAVAWDGTPEKRIHVKLDWKRRRPED